MGVLSPQQEHELRIREIQQERELHDQDRKLRERELEQRILETRYSRWNGPLAAAIIAGAIAWYGYHTSERESFDKLEAGKRELCYKVLSDTINRHQGAAVNQTTKELELVARSVSSNADCQDTLREAADSLFTSNTINTTAPPATAGRCEKFESIKKLGWTSGHKTHFCNAVGYADVFNPFGDYSDGGFCFTGDANACRTAIQAQGR